MTNKDKFGGRRLDAEEAALWRQVADGITPLASRKNRLSRMTHKKESPGERKLRSTIKPNPPNELVAEAPLRHGAAPGLDRRTQMRLKRGQVEIEARIDLHGLGREEAHRALDGFIEASCAAGRRAVLVITGKGARTGERVGVLREAVPKWLNERPFRARVKAFSHAARHHGGEGALYVLLKKKR